MTTSRRGFIAGSLGLGALGAVSLAGCGREEAQSGASGAAEARGVVFAHAANPPSLDPVTGSHLETSRIAGAVLESLVHADPVTGSPTAHLAESWDLSEDGLTCTFTLRQGVSFQDGTAFDAEAVAANFRRWRRVVEQAGPEGTDLFPLFGPAAQGGQSIYADCTILDEHRVRLELNERHAPLLVLLTQPAFGIASPQAFEDEEAFARHPVGTGPYRMRGWDGDTVSLERFEDYWGDPPGSSTLSFRAVRDAQRRYYELVSSAVDAYDQVGTGDFVDLARRGVQIQQRDPYAVTYIALNQGHELLQSLNMRRAVARSLDRGAIASKYFPEGTKVADDFTPALFQVGGENTRSAYRRDTGGVKRLLGSIGYDEEPLEFWYPTGISLPYLQRPEAVYAELAADLTDVGLRIVPKPIPWEEDYQRRISEPSSTRALALSGLMGAYRDPSAFIGRLFDGPGEQFGVDDTRLRQMIRQAAASDDDNDRSRRYQRINEHLAGQLLAVPLVYPISAVALGPRIRGYSVSSTGVEDFSDLTTAD